MLFLFTEVVIYNELERRQVIVESVTKKADDGNLIERNGRETSQIYKYIKPPKLHYSYNTTNRHFNNCFCEF